MPELTFQVVEVTAMEHAAAPALAARVRIANARPSQPVHSISLNCQVSLEPRGRGYSPREEAMLLELFGERERWSRSMKPLWWTSALIGVPGFKDEQEFELQLPCTLDFDVAATKYFHALEQGSIGASIVFSGTVFYAGTNGMLQVMQIPWQSEARFHVAVEQWRTSIDAHYPGAFWLRLPRDIFDRLYRYRVANQIPSWERLIQNLLDGAETADESSDLSNPDSVPFAEAKS